jgi:hypothetical protein
MVRCDFEARAEKPLASQNSIDSRQQFPSRVQLRKEANGTRAQRCDYDESGVIFAREQDPGRRRNFPDSASSFDTVQRWKPDVEQEKIRLQFPRSLNCLKPV